MRLPQHYKRFLLFEVHGAANGTPASRLVEIALALRPHGRGVIVELPSSGGQLQELAVERLLGVSVDAKSLPRNVRQATTSLTRLVTAASALNLKVFVQGVNTVGILEAAQKARANDVDGRAVALPTAEPKTAYHWTPHCTNGHRP